MVMILDANLKHIRKKRNLTVYFLADELGVSASTVRAWEAGIRKPDTENLIKLSKILDVNPNYILGISGLQPFPRHHSPEVEQFLQKVSSKFTHNTIDKIAKLMEEGAWLDYKYSGIDLKVILHIKDITDLPLLLIVSCSNKVNIVKANLNKLSLIRRHLSIADESDELVFKLLEDDNWDKYNEDTWPVNDDVMHHYVSSTVEDISNHIDSFTVLMIDNIVIPKFKK